VIGYSQESSQATTSGLGPGSRVPALDEGPKKDLTNDRSKSPLEEKVFAVIPLVVVLIPTFHRFSVCFDLDYYFLINVFFYVKKGTAWGLLENHESAIFNFPGTSSIASYCTPDSIYELSDFIFGIIYLKDGTPHT
jgi:hypothetical protein